MEKSRIKARFCLDGAPVTRIVDLVCAVFVLLFLYQGVFGLFRPYIHRSLYLLFTMVLVFALKKDPKESGGLVARVSGWDLLLIIAVTVSIVYFIFHYVEFCEKAGLPLSKTAIAMGVIAVGGAVETCRKQMGLALPLITLTFLAYLFVGPYLPGFLNHTGFDLDSVIGILYAGTDGLFGQLTYIFAYYIFPFLVFGTFLRRSGATDFFIELGKACFGRTTGGMAKAAAISSGLLGSIMGSCTANVAITGAVTIPAMKKEGYPPHFAAAVESSASLGGSILPPIMGAAAFLLSSLTSIPYRIVIAKAAIPGLLYFYHVFLSIHLYAKRKYIQPLQRQDIPGFLAALKAGWYYFTPMLVITYFIAAGYSLSLVATTGIISAAACAQVNRRTRMSLKDFYTTLAQAAKDSLIIGATACAIAIIATAIDLPGLGLVFSAKILELSGGIVPFLILLALVTSYVLGMGLPITAAYLILVILAAPALQELGIPLFTAHLLVLWYSQDSTITPPVCPSVFTAMSIAGLPGRKMWQTGLQAVHLSHGLYYIPFFFLYNPGLLLEGSLADILIATLAAIGLVTNLTVATEGQLLVRLRAIERVLFVAAGVGLFLPMLQFKIIGFLLTLAGWTIQFYRRRMPAVDAALAGIEERG